MARTAIPLADRLVLTIPQVASLCGVTHSYLYTHLDAAADGMSATVGLPGGAVVPVHKSPHGYWVCYRAQLDAAIAAHGQVSA